MKIIYRKINAGARVNIKQKLYGATLRTGGKSPDETTTKSMVKTPAIADSRYHGIADTSRDPKVTVLLFYSRYDNLDVH